MANDLKMTDNDTEQKVELRNCAFFDCEAGFQTDRFKKKEILLDFYGILDASLVDEKKDVNGKYKQDAIHFMIDYAYKNFKDELDAFLSDEKNIEKYQLKERRVYDDGRRKSMHIEPPLCSEDFKWDPMHPKYKYEKYEIYKMAYIALEVINQHGGVIPTAKIRALQNARKRHDVIVKAATEHPDELRAIGFNDEQIKAAKLHGRLPNGYNVHHKFNRFHTLGMEIDYNAAENLVVIKSQEFGKAEKYEHEKIHEYINAQNNAVKDKSQTAPLNLVWIPGCVYDPNRKMTAEEIKKQSAAEMRKVFKPKTAEERQKVEDIINNMTVPYPGAEAVVSVTAEKANNADMMRMMKRKNGYDK